MISSLNKLLILLSMVIFRSFQKLCIAFIFLLFSANGRGQHLSVDIRLNQTGFYPQGKKIAVLAKDQSGKFMIMSPDLAQTFYTGELSASHKSEYSPTSTRVADFSGFKTPGTYVVYIPEVGYSYQFDIKAGVHEELAKAALKSYYFQRMSTPLSYSYGGKWSRPAGHSDDKVLIHPSAASAQRKEGSAISSPKGWYDAGDYNKYIVNSGITMGTMLSLYEDYPAFCKQMTIDIPEQSNSLPDLLDELLWNLRWMLTMQDPNDGGVYHKLTNPSFDGIIMPADATAPRYVVQKSTAASLDFAAVTAQAARIFKNFGEVLPGLADSCLKASEKAWSWAVKNPNVLYKQNEMNSKFKPEVVTGEYGDNNVQDEFIWAASELYITTGNANYYKAVNLFPDVSMPVPSWSDVRLLGYYSLLRFEKQLTPVSTKDIPSLKKSLLAEANELLLGYQSTAYVTPMCKSEKNFIWGSNAVAANQAILLLQAYRLTKDPNYTTGALEYLDYLLGRNATGYSYITGYGDKTPMFPHHRPSGADEVREPVPGLLVGGPNPGKQDKCEYPSSIADEAYTDVMPSYASNEVAINWNAPFVYLVWAIEDIYR
jgi:endoglucanase